MNSLNNSPLASFDGWLKQNYYFTNMQKVNLPSSSSVGNEISDFGALVIHVLNSNNGLVSAQTVQMLATNFSIYGETKFFFFSVYSMPAKAQYFL